MTIIIDILALIGFAFLGLLAYAVIAGIRADEKKWQENPEEHRAFRQMEQFRRNQARNNQRDQFSGLSDDHQQHVTILKARGLI